MRWPTMTTRRWAIAIGVIALVLVPIKIIYNLNDSLEAFYGPNGKLALEHELVAKITEADQLLDRGDGVQAEAILRAAAAVRDRLLSINQRQGWRDDIRWDSHHLASGMGAALSSQGRATEAEAYHKTAVASLGTVEADDKLWEALVLQRSARNLRLLHRDDEATAQEARAVRALVRVAGCLRAAGRDPEAGRLDARVAALRQDPGIRPQ